MVQFEESAEDKSTTGCIMRCVLDKIENILGEEKKYNFFPLFQQYFQGLLQRVYKTWDPLVNLPK